jgi:hypothetical protein
MRALPLLVLMLSCGRTQLLGVGEVASGGGTFSRGGGAGGGLAQGGGDPGVDGGPVIMPVRASRAGVPTVVFVVDTSSSMETALVTGNGCPPTCGPNNPCPSSCLTRWVAVRTFVQNVTGQFSALGRFALMHFPTTASCGSPSSLDVRPSLLDDPPALHLVATQVGAEVAQLVRRGGTPTSAALKFVATAPDLVRGDRETLAVLVTDGLPNCDTMNPNTCADPDACQCTSANCGGTLCTVGCLDQSTPTVAGTLRAQGVQTMVVGVGAEAVAPSIERLAVAGNFAPTCTNDADCPATVTCDLETHACARKSFFIGDPKLTANTTALLGKWMREAAACAWRLENAAGIDQGKLRVSLDGVLISSGFGMSGAVVRFTGATCERLLAGATPTFAVAP